MNRFRRQRSIPIRLPGSFRANLCLFGLALLMVDVTGCRGPERTSGAESSPDAGVNSILDGGGTEIRGPRTIGSRVIDQVEIDAYAALCQNISRCEYWRHSNLAECVNLYTESEVSAWQSDVAVFASIRAGKATLDEKQWASCLTQLAKQSCSVEPMRSPFSIPECADAVKGKLKTGESCVTSLACDSSMQCVPDAVTTDLCSGTCRPVGGCKVSSECSDDKVCVSHSCVTARPSGASGEACGTGLLCQDGLYCDSRAGGPGRCRALPKSGESCPAAAGVPCGEQGLFCVPDTQGNGTCRVPKKAGESCEAAYDCWGPGYDLYCDLKAKSCARLPASGPCVNMACDPLTSYCDDVGSENATCEAFVPEGGDCSGARACTPRMGLSCLRSEAGAAVCARRLFDPCPP